MSDTWGSVGTFGLFKKEIVLYNQNSKKAFINSTRREI